MNMTKAQENKINYIRSEVERIANELDGVVWDFNVDPSRAEGSVFVTFRITDNEGDVPSFNKLTGRFLSKSGSIFVGPRGGMTFVYFPKRKNALCSIRRAKCVEDIWGGANND